MSEAAPTPRWLSSEEQATWRAYLRAVRTVDDALDRQLHDDAGLAAGHYEVLVRLSEAEGRRLRMSDLADDTLFSRSRLSHAVGRLEAQGLIRRTACPNDKRGTFAELTDEGFAVLAATAPGHVAAVRRVLFDALSPEQVGQLRRILDAVAAHAGARAGSA